MQTDRQDLDKRHIELKCVEPHIAFPDCDGSLKLTKYGYKVDYEDEVACADLIKTCTIIEKEISRRPEAGDPGGLPDVPIPVPIESSTPLGTAYSFAKSSELDDGKLLVIHFLEPSQFKIGFIKLSLFTIAATGDPILLTTVDVETPGGSAIYANGDINVVTFDSDTFVLAYYAGGESSLLKGSISGINISFDYYIVKIADERMYQVNFSKFDSNSGFAVFVNRITTTLKSMVVLAYTYNGSTFTQLITKQTIDAGYPANLTVPSPPVYDPPDACGGTITYNDVNQAYGFNMALVKETGDYYQFSGGHIINGTINYVQIYNAFQWCMPLPAQITKVIFVPTTIKMYKDTGALSCWHSASYRRYASGLTGYLQVKRIGSTEKVVGLYSYKDGKKHVVFGLELIGNYAIIKRSFTLPSASTFTSGAIYSLSNEYFAAAVTGDNNNAIKFYPLIWLENNAFFGHLGGGSEVDIAGINSLEIAGTTLSNGRVCVLRSYYGFHGNIHLLDISYV